MAGDEVKLLQSSLILLRTSMTEAQHFLETWHEKYQGIEENYEDFKETVKHLRDALGVAVKETKDYRDLQEAVNTSRELLKVVHRLEAIITGPLVIIQASRDLAWIAQQVTKLIGQAGTIDTGDEEHIFSMLKTEQINQVYQWVAENEAIRK